MACLTGSWWFHSSSKKMDVHNDRRIDLRIRRHRFTAHARRGRNGRTVLSDSVVVWHHTLPARPTAIPIAAAETHRLKDFISSILLFVK